jgi:hemerythrin-like metal-binding protein
MEAVVWISEFEVGVASVDEQHKRLVDMLNALGQAIGSGQGKQAIMGIVEDMKQYAVYHFKTEEDAMEASDYPKRSQHKQEHDTFIEQVLDATDALESGGKITPQGVWAFLHKWLIEHILDSDKAMGTHLNAHGVH